MYLIFIKIPSFLSQACFYNLLLIITDSLKMNHDNSWIKTKQGFQASKSLSFKIMQFLYVGCYLKDTVLFLGPILEKSTEGTSFLKKLT